MYHYSKFIDYKKKYDVIVAGGGVAGVAAAISVAKRGNSVLIIEKSNVLGGLATLGLINLFVPMCNGNGKQIIYGLCEKWARMSTKYGYDTIPCEWKNGEPKEPTKVRYTQRFSAYIFALQLLEEARNYGVDILFDCLCCEPIKEDDRFVGVITESKSGTELYGCKELIDTTGDCDLMRHGGVPTVKGKNYHTYLGLKATLESCQDAINEHDIYKLYRSVTGGSINLHGDNQPSDVPLYSGLSVDEVTEYLLNNQMIMLDSIKNDDRMARDIIQLPFMPQFRTTCHIDGDYTFRFNDCYKHFDDSVCAINDFQHRFHLFEVPLRSLTRKDSVNIITAGRSVCAEGFGWDIVRVIPPAIMTGQAAGEAAVLALEENKNIADITVKTLQERMEEANCMVHFPDELVPEDKTIKFRGRDFVDIDGGHY